MANWGGALSGAGSGAAAGSMIMPGWGTAIGGVAGGLLGLFSGKKKKNSQGAMTPQTLMDLYSKIINEYSYKPQYTGQTEASLFNLFQDLTGQSGKGVGGIPFDIGLPTTGLYDSLTRDITEKYLGTPGGPEGGLIDDLKAYYNNLGVPEQAINQERLAYKDLNNSLVDQAALINESQKDRLANILNIGTSAGQNLYSQNLAQHRSNAGLMGTAALGDYSLLDTVNQANQGSLMDLIGGSFGELFSNGSDGTGGSDLSGLLGSVTGGGNTSVNRSGTGGTLGTLFQAAKPFVSKLISGASSSKSGGII